jgi:hypothetical protein
MSHVPHDGTMAGFVKMPSNTSVERTAAAAAHRKSRWAAQRPLTSEESS